MISVESLTVVLTVLAALGSGLIGGVFFAFSTSVMKALGQRPAAEGMAAMQGINAVILNPLFLGAFLGTALVCMGALILSVIRWSDAEIFLFAGSIVYLIGSALVTMALNVPLNNTLAAADPLDDKSKDLWANYLSNWTFWNHVRTAASIASSTAFILGLIR